MSTPITPDETLEERAAREAAELAAAGALLQAHLAAIPAVESVEVITSYGHETEAITVRVTVSGVGFKLRVGQRHFGAKQMHEAVHAAAVDVYSLIDGHALGLREMVSAFAWEPEAATPPAPDALKGS